MGLRPKRRNAGSRRGSGLRRGLRQSGRRVRGGGPWSGTRAPACRARNGVGVLGFPASPARNPVLPTVSIPFRRAALHPLT